MCFPVNLDFNLDLNLHFVRGFPSLPCLTPERGIPQSLNGQVQSPRRRAQSAAAWPNRSGRDDLIPIMPTTSHNYQY